MTALAALVLCLQVTVVPDSPTDTSWPIAGKANRPDGTVLKLVAVRVERRWDPTAERFREFLSPESRLTRSAEVGGAAWQCKLKNGPTGVYDVAVNEGDKRVHSERMLLGGAGPLFASTRRSLPKLLEVCDRAAAYTGELQQIIAGKQPGTAAAREAFIKRVHADEQSLQEMAGRTDLTGTIFLLNDLLSQIRNAQIWELPPGTKDEELNDGKVGDRDVFLDAKLTFTSLKASIAGVRTTVSRELSLSTAALLDRILARTPERLLNRARDAASEAMKILEQAPVEDKDAKAAVQAAMNAETSTLAEIRKGLQELAAKHLAQ
jgi:hypothetical protein